MFATRPKPDPLPTRGSDSAAGAPARSPAGAMDDEELRGWIRLAQAGELEAFERIYREYVGVVYAMTRRLVPAPARAEELTQDVFVRVWEHIGSYRFESPFRGWLRTVAVNVVRMELRSQVRREERVAVRDEVTLRDSSRVEPAPERALDLAAAVDRLPPGARSVFVLYDVEGYAHGEIAEALGVTTGTSKAQLHRARRLLREMLQ